MDLVHIADHGRGSALDQGSAPTRDSQELRWTRAPAGFGPSDLARLFEHFLPRFRSDAADWHAKDNADPEWRLLMVAGMWFQDLFNFDFDVIGMDPAQSRHGLGRDLVLRAQFGRLEAGTRARSPDCVARRVAQGARPTSDLRERNHRAASARAAERGSASAARTEAGM